MTKTLLALAGVVAVTVPAVTLAQTYHYVSVEGDIEAIEADTAAEALVMAPDIHPNSGVAEDRGLLEEGMDADVPVGGTGGANMYAYVDITGEVETITAPNPSVAITAPADIHPNSGVAIVTSDDPDEPLEE